MMYNKEFILEKIIPVHWIIDFTLIVFSSALNDNVTLSLFTTSIKYIYIYQKIKLLMEQISLMCIWSETTIECIYSSLRYDQYVYACLVSQTSKVRILQSAEEDS